MPENADRRLEISLRLKAARHLLGTRNAKGQAVPASAAQIARLPALAKNNVTKNRLEDIEQMKVDARPYELSLIATALGMPVVWFDPNDESDEGVEQASRNLWGMLNILGLSAQARRKAREALEQADPSADRPEQDEESDPS